MNTTSRILGESKPGFSERFKLALGMAIAANTSFNERGHSQQTIQDW